MNTSKVIELNRVLPVRGAGCCIDLRPNPLSESAAQEQAQLFAALADPTRLRILALLAAQPAPLCVCEINAAFPLHQPTISHHLKLLCAAGLVRREKRGLWVYYAPHPEGLAEVAVLLAALQSPLPSLLERYGIGCQVV